MEQDFTQQIMDLNNDITQEMKEWDVLNMHPSNIQFDNFIGDSWEKALVDILVEKGIFTELEFVFTFKKRLLENLKEARFKFAPEVMENRRNKERIVRPLKGIHLGNGEFRPIE